jgi:hypothetical protein
LLLFLWKAAPAPAAVGVARRDSLAQALTAAIFKLISESTGADGLCLGLWLLIAVELPLAVAALMLLLTITL